MFKKSLSIPFIVWIICGTIIPLLVVFYYGFTDKSGAFTFENIFAITEPTHMQSLILALTLSLISTIVCLALALPLALILKSSKFARNGLVIFIFILPMWMNFLLRTMAWQVLLERGGILQSMLDVFNLPMIEIINTPVAVVLVMVYDFLPFMVLPIFNTLLKIDEGIIDAAKDLGADGMTVFFKITLPMIVPGIVSGVTMVFVPALTTFVISNMIGGNKMHLIGNIIEQEFTVSNNWNLGAGLSLVMMIFILASMLLFMKFDKDNEGNLF